MARIAIIEPRSSGYGLIGRAAELGHEPVVVTAGVGGRRIPEQHLRSAHHVEIVDTNDERSVLEAVERLNSKESLDAVIPGFEHYVPLAANLADMLGVPGISAAVAGRLHFKHLMRTALETAKIDQPRFAVVRSNAELRRAIGRVGLPCVVKPVDQSGSLHVRKASTADEVGDAFETVRRCGDPDLQRPAHSAVLLEEYIQGPEVSVEGTVEGGFVHVLSVTTKLLGAEPYFVEIGHVLPGDISEAARRGLAGYVTTVLHALDLKTGPFHAEVRMSARGPLLVEVAARLPGDNIPRLLALARGVDLHEVMVNAYLGLRRETEFPDFQQYAGIRYLVRPGLRDYRTANIAPRMRNSRRIQEIAVVAPPGVPLPPATSSRGRLAYVIATGSTYRDVGDFLQQVDEESRFE